MRTVGAVKPSARSLRPIWDAGSAPRAVAIARTARASRRAIKLRRSGVSEESRNLLFSDPMVGRVTPCAPEFLADDSNGAHGVTRPTMPGYGDAKGEAVLAAFCRDAATPNSWFFMENGSIYLIEN